MSVARLARAQFGESGVHLRRGNRATLDVDQPVNVAPVITDNAILRVNGDAVAIAVRFG